MSKSTRSNGDVDWIGYARKRGFATLPKKERHKCTPAAFVREVPDLCETATQMRYGGDAVVVLKTRLLRPLHRQISLARVGASLSQSGEETRLTEQRIVRLFRDIVLRDEYTGCPFRLRDEFLAPLRELVREFRDARIEVMSVSEWERYLWKFWRLRTKGLFNSERLILEILGYGNLALKYYAPSISRGDVLGMRVRLRQCETSVSAFPTLA